MTFDNNFWLCSLSLQRRNFSAQKTIQHSNFGKSLAGEFVSRFYAAAVLLAAICFFVHFMGLTEGRS